MLLDPATLAWGGAVAMILLALGAGIGDHRRKRRADLDRIGWVDWPSVQIVALGAAFLFASIAFNV